jgi:hypothetical protein
MAEQWRGRREVARPEFAVAQSHLIGSAIGTPERRIIRSKGAQSKNVLESSQVVVLKGWRRLRMDVTETPKLVHRAGQVFVLFFRKLDFPEDSTWDAGYGWADAQRSRAVRALYL